MEIDNNRIEISFWDLKEDIQKEFLKAMGLNSPEDGNYDIFPIAVIEIPED